jgi:hypothetical protein
VAVIRRALAAPGWSTPGRSISTARVALVCGSALVLLALGRLVVGGWDALSADHARYVYAGLSLINGRGYVNEAGDPFLFRAPAFALLTGGGWQVAGSLGAHLVTWVLGVASLLLAVAFGARLGGAVAAVVTTAAIATVPLFWEQVVGLGIDQPQAALFLGAIALLWEPATGRWLAAGALMGLGLLVKETLAPAVVLLPAAWLPIWTSLGWPRWLRLSAALGMAVLVVAAWWWIVVWRATGDIFPLNSLRAIVPDEAPLELTPSAAALVGLSAALLAWVIVAITRVRDPRARLLLFGGLATLPAGVATLVLAQPSRNLTAMALLTCVAIGVAAAELWRRLAPRLHAGARPTARHVGAGAGVVLLVFAILGQVAVNPARSDQFTTATADAIRGRLAPGDHVVSTFRNRSILGVELFDRGVPIELVPVRPVPEGSDVSEYLWLGVRRGTLFGIRRDRWAEVLGARGAAFLTVATPHPLSPTELLPALRGRAGRTAGLTEIDHIVGANGSSYLYANDPTRAGRMGDAALHAAPDALLMWLERATDRGEQNPIGRLLAERPVILDGARQARNLAERLGRRACFRSAREGGRRVIKIEARGSQPDCLVPSDLR